MGPHALLPEHPFPGPRPALALPTQDQVYGFYYLTLLDKDALGKGKAFRSVEEALKAHEAGVLSLHAPIRILIDGELVETTLGRAILNGALPRELRDYTLTFDVRQVRRKIEECYLRFGWERTAQVLDELKSIGFRYATLSGLTIAVPDCVIPPRRRNWSGLPRRRWTGSTGCTAGGWRRRSSGTRR